MATTHGSRAGKAVQSQESNGEDPNVILEQANKAVSRLKKADITELKSLSAPPALVKLVMESICVLMGIEPERRSGSTAPDYWASSKRFLADPNVLKRFVSFDKDHIPPEIMHKLRTKYINHPDFNPASAAAVSQACAGLCWFVLGIEQYDRCLKHLA